MKIIIDGEEISEINITDSDGGLIASIGTDDVITIDGINVSFVKAHKE